MDDEVDSGRHPNCKFGMTFRSEIVSLVERFFIEGLKSKYHIYIEI